MCTAVCLPPTSNPTKIANAALNSFSTSYQRKGPLTAGQQQFHVWDIIYPSLFAIKGAPPN